MSIFNEFFKKEKPVFTGIARGAGGFGFGSAGESGPTFVGVTGGTKSINGSYTVHTFLSSGSLVVSGLTQPDVQYLIVGGGGGGGAGDFTGGAGGGGGGLRTSVPGKTPGGPGASTESVLILPAGTYAITVGAGGGISANPVSSPTFSPPPSAGNAGSRGGDSSIVGGSVNLIAYGGGGGGGYSTVGQPGASGGGGGGNDAGTQAGGNRNRDSSNNPTPNQGYPGGTALIGGPQNYAGGGGGGAGGSGTQSNSGTGEAHCDGGPGLPNNIDGTDYWYAGGGGGTGYTAQGGAGGKGGGGGGNCVSAGVPQPSGGGSARSNGQNGGTSAGGPNGAGKNAGKGGANTGGGGGGYQHGTPYFATPPETGNDAGHGGSGIVIIRYPT